jgi:hypothetical protein
MLHVGYVERERGMYGSVNSGGPQEQIGCPHMMPPSENRECDGLGHE